MDDDPLAPFRWHPEPELIGIRDSATSRAALERAGEATWRASLDWLYDEAMARAVGHPTGYAELRSLYVGETGGPGAAPAAKVLLARRARRSGEAAWPAQGELEKEADAAPSDSINPQHQETTK